MQGNVLGQSGGSAKINGIIEEYKVASGGNVNAGDFVRFLSDYTETGEITDKEIINSKIYKMSATALSNSKIFIAYKRIDSNGVYGIVCAINGVTITVGTETQLTNASTSGDYISITNLSNDKVFVASKNSGSSGSISGIFCTVNNNLITVKATTSISSYGDSVSVTALSNDKVFITYTYTNSKNPYGVICTINNTSITKGTETKLSTNTGYGELLVLTLSENKVYIACGYSSSKLICIINGTTITAGNIQAVGLSYNSATSSIVALSDNKVLELMRNSSIINAQICTINETSITAGETTQLSIEAGTSGNVSATVLSNDKVFISYSYKSDFLLYGMLCTINETSITADTNIKLSSNTESGYRTLAIALSESQIAVIHFDNNTNRYVYGIILDYPINLVKTITSSTERIEGVAKTGGNAGETIKAYKPNI